jgi:hypothetical protein
MEAIKTGKIDGSQLPLFRTGGDALQYLKDNYSCPWADHFGVLEVDGHESLVTEPYAEKVTKEMIDILNAGIGILGGAYLFSATSWWYPGRTIRIYIAENREMATQARNHEGVFETQD